MWLVGQDAAHDIYTVSISARTEATAADAQGTPEDLLIAAEEKQCIPMNDAEDDRDLAGQLGVGRGGLDHLLDRIPACEADAISLYFDGARRTMTEIGTILDGLTQAAIWYRINRGIARLRWLAHEHTWFTPDDIRRDLTKYLWLKPERVEVLVGMWEMTCQTEVARRLGWSQGKLLYAFRKLLIDLDRLAIEHPELSRYRDGFHALYDNLGILYYQQKWTDERRKHLSAVRLHGRERDRQGADRGGDRGEFPEAEAHLGDQAPPRAG